jgi:aspartyl-tRNA(Asn)/glutamyl-tRNA(Gln) amidotransferase subunit B
MLNYYYRRIKMEYEAIIGLEIHVQLKTESKMFCPCSTEFGASPNSQVCPICLGLPGALPVLNEKVVEQAVKAALVLNCHIQKVSSFDKKIYFYPDLPKGYQISQYYQPLAKSGYIDIKVKDKRKKVRIRHLHMEEDVGKLIHQKEMSLVDFNRAGLPLIEIVTEPDIRSSEEAGEFLMRLQSNLRYAGVSECNMEEGSLRCDANVSLRPLDTHKLYTKTEVKNMNSFKHVMKAIEYEIKRQKRSIGKGEKAVLHTRRWDPERGVTIKMRGKALAPCIPHPDLGLVIIEKGFTLSLRHQLPELSLNRSERFIQQYKIPASAASILTSSKELADYYEECIKARYKIQDTRYKFNKDIANWIMSELLRELKERDIGIEKCKISPQALAEMIALIDKGSISGKMAKEVFVEMFKTGKKASRIVKENGLAQISDEKALTKIVDKILKENPKVVEDYKKGKEKALGYLVGRIMKETKGRANPQLANKLLKEKLR